MIPKKQKIVSASPSKSGSRKVILFSGCVQPALTPNTNHVAIKVFEKLGIGAVTVSGESCCGAIDYHMAATDSAKNFIRKNIDVWWAYIEEGVEAIIVTASGCGVMIKDYGYILRNDPEYADKANRISAMTKDLTEALVTEEIVKLKVAPEFQSRKVAFHNPCTLQHGQGLKDVAETLLKKLGVQLTTVVDDHICCGSAGVYSVLQANLAQRLQSEKIQALEAGRPELIVTANIGCQLHLQKVTNLSVKHWVELLADTDCY
jgi:glycolate oxidase iron-sulfur subunit